MPDPSPASDRFDCIGIVVHPTRDIDGPLATLRTWADAHDARVGQLPAAAGRPDLAPPVAADECDLVVALGGDGTTLVALHAAAQVGKAVLGVACGSLGALTATSPAQFEGALDRIAAGDWTTRDLPAVVAERDGHAPRPALNDLVLVRTGAGQVVVEVAVDGERYIRFSGDGLIAATPLGSSAYTLAAGGPMLVQGSRGLVLTPLAAHGGVVPPLVTTEHTRVTVTFDPGHGGARLEADGQVAERLDPEDVQTLTLRFEPAYAQLVALGEQEAMITGLRRRRLLVDSPRVLARDAREGRVEP